MLHESSPIRLLGIEFWASFNRSLYTLGIWTANTEISPKKGKTTNNSLLNALVKQNVCTERK